VSIQSAENKNKEDPFSFKVKLPSPQIIDNIEIGNLSALQVPTKEKELVQSPPNSFKKSENDIIKKIKANENTSSLLNQQACRDNIDVTYRVIDQNAVSGIFQAKIQAQGVILSLSQDQKDIKLKTTGWFTKNPNLQKWQPFLKNPPLAKGILLKVGSEFWDSKSNWYLCGVN